MKKRAKIITTVASLCLAVALMAFGVYAASQVTFGVTSTVSFTVTDVFVTITGEVSKNSSAATGGTSLDTFAAWRSYTPAVTEGQDQHPNLPTNPGEDNLTTDPTWTIGNQDLSADEPYVIYVVTISNDAGKAIKVTASVTAGTYNSENMTRVSYQYKIGSAAAVDVVDGNTTASGNVAVGSSIVYTYIARVTDLTADVTAFQLDFTYDIVQA